jgi:hypothetical protein
LLENNEAYREKLILNPSVGRAVANSINLPFKHDNNNRNAKKKIDTLLNFLMKKKNKPLAVVKLSECLN